GPPLDVGGLPDRAGRPRLAHPLQEHGGQAQGFRSVHGDRAVRTAHDEVLRPLGGGPAEFRRGGSWAAAGLGHAWQSRPSARRTTGRSISSPRPAVVPTPTATTTVTAQATTVSRTRGRRVPACWGGMRSSTVTVAASADTVVTWPLG